MTLIPEDVKPDYETKTMIYTVELPAIETFDTTDTDLAERFSANGARVTAQKGWE